MKREKKLKNEILEAISQQPNLTLHELLDVIDGSLSKTQEDELRLFKKVKSACNNLVDEGKLFPTYSLAVKTLKQGQELA